MKFFKGEKLNNNKEIDTLEEKNIFEDQNEKKVPATQDPDLEILTTAQVFENRKNLHKLVEKASEIREKINNGDYKKYNKEEEKILEIKAEINEIIGNKKE